MLNTIRRIKEATQTASVGEPSLLNFAVTDGKSVVATRYVTSSTDEAASLYFSTGTSFEEVETDPLQLSKPGQYRMVCLSFFFFFFFLLETESETLFHSVLKSHERSCFFFCGMGMYGNVA